MESKQDKQALVTRLALCVVVALIVYYGGEKLCEAFKISLWEQYQPWLEKNKIQAIATVAAVLFGISLAVYPLEGKKKPLEEETCQVTPPPEGFTPCEGDF